MRRKKKKKKSARARETRVMSAHGRPFSSGEKIGRARARRRLTWRVPGTTRRAPSSLSTPPHARRTPTTPAPAQCDTASVRRVMGSRGTSAEAGPGRRPQDLAGPPRAPAVRLGSRHLEREEVRDPALALVGTGVAALLGWRGSSLRWWWWCVIQRFERFRSVGRAIAGERKGDHSPEFGPSARERF